MRKLVYILASAGLWWPATAAADEPSALVHARAVASAYWHNASPPVVFVALPPLVRARANETTGDIELANTVNWQLDPEMTCIVFVHEDGHLVLGAGYFYASNPTDPAHSPDPNNIMYGGGELGDGPEATPEQGVQESKSVGCYEAPVSVRHKAHQSRHHRRHH